MEYQVYHSPYTNLANKEIEWLPMDSEDRYQENLKFKSKVLERYGWLNSKFTYKFNSHGFRCEEFTEDPSIVFLGCSMTVGVGLPIEATWPTLVSNELNLKCYNLGIGGASNDTAFRLALYWLEKIKPKMVVFCRTFPTRMEVFSATGAIANIADELPEFYLNYWTRNIHNVDLLQKKNSLAIMKLSEEIDAKFVQISVTDFQPLQVDLARDLAHPGVQTNIKVSELVLSKIN